jgi:hypothetical protein
VRIEIQPEFVVNESQRGPTTEQQREILEIWRAFPARLAVVEPEWRRATAEQITRDIMEHQPENPFPQEEFAAGLELDRIRLNPDEGWLQYSSPEFGDNRITVTFTLDLSFQEAEL